MSMLLRIKSQTRQIALLCTIPLGIPIPGCGGNRDCPLGMVKVNTFHAMGDDLPVRNPTEIQGEWYLAASVPQKTE
eukprot:1495900-Rhodomonas_salina.2